jgi:hypothetical protein
VLRNEPELLAVADAVAATQLAAVSDPVTQESRSDVKAPERRDGDVDPSAEM